MKNDGIDIKHLLLKPLKLMPHQESAKARLEKSKGRQLLSLPCGAGKTLTTLIYLLEQKTKSVLILAPKSIIGVWTKEARTWFGLSITDMSMGDRQAKWIDFLKNGGWCVISYESFLRDWDKSLALRSMDFGALVLDESSKIKNPTTKISKCVRKVKADKKILLNATVIENSLGDLWAQAETVAPGSLYGNFYICRAQHAVMNQYFPGVKYWKDKEKVINMVGDHVFSVSKEEVTKNLPPITEQVIPLTLTPEQEYTYARVRDEFLIDIDGETETVANALTKLMRLRQCTNGLWAFGDNDSKSCKVEALKELLESFGDEKAIVFTQFAETALAMRAKLPKLCTHIITGGEHKRDVVIEDWEKHGKALIGTSACAKGMNLQSARYVVFIDLFWTYAMYEQAIGRVWRTGQQKPVTVYSLEAEGTVDEKIHKLILDKKEDGDLLTSLTLEDIKNLIL